jgi:hypothetical protein
MIDVFDRQIQLILMAKVAAVRRAAIGKHPQQRNLVRIKEGHHPIAE